MPEAIQASSIVERAACIFEENFPVGTTCWVPDRHLVRVVKYYQGNGKIRAGFGSTVVNAFDPSQLFSEPPKSIDNLGFYRWLVVFYRMGRIVGVSGEDKLPFINKPGVVVQYEYRRKYAVQIGPEIYPAVLTSKVYGFRRMTLTISGEVEDVPKALPSVFVREGTGRKKVDVVYVPAGFDYEAYLAEVNH